MIKTLDEEEYMDMAIRSARMTNHECNEKVCAEAQQKHCPVVKANCIGDDCAFFVVDRPCNDKRILEARCTYMGTRTLSMWYGKPKEEEDD